MRLALAGLVSLLLCAGSLEALDLEAVPIYSGLALGDLSSQEWAKAQGARELNPLHSGKLGPSVAAHLGGTALVIYGDSKLPKKWQRWALRGAYMLWTGYKVQANIRAGQGSKPR